MFVLSVLFLLGNTVLIVQGSNSKCAVVIFVNQSSFRSEYDFSEYIQNIQGLSLDKTKVYFSDDPDTFKVKRGEFIDAPGLFALESERYPEMYLRRANHTMVLQQKQASESFKNDATFLTDYLDKNESFTTLKLFAHRSWKLFSMPDSKTPLLFDNSKKHLASGSGYDLLVVTQPCTNDDANPGNDTSSSKSDVYAKGRDDEVGSGSISVGKSLDAVKGPEVLSDPTLNRKTDTKYLTAITNKGKLNTITNEYSYENFKIPDFIMHSLVEDDKNADDGIEAPKPNVKATANIVSDNAQHHGQTVEHETKLPTAKQKISELSNLISDPEANDLESNLRDLQYGSKGCKLLVAEDTMEEGATSKDTVAHPKKAKVCADEFPDSCKEMAKNGYCLAFKSLMSAVCRKSCNLCSSLVDTGFTSCTKSCGGGRQMRMIKIHRREYLQTKRCNTQPCPIDGGYSEFGPYTECSVTCGIGVKFRRRTCTKPRPQFNGRSCKRLGNSIESKRCDAGPCPKSKKHLQHDKNHKKRAKGIRGSKHDEADLHIGGPHSDKVHKHLILLKGKKVAKLRCTPRKGQLRSIIQDAVTKRYTVHKSINKHSSKRSYLEEGEVLYNHEGLPVDTSRTVVKAFKSPYKIILARKGKHNMKFVEECLETNDSDQEKSSSNNDRSSEWDTGLSEEIPTKAISHERKRNKNEVFTRPGEKSFLDFDEYKYETGNIVTPQVTTSPDDDDDDNEQDYAIPSGKIFDVSNGLDAFMDKINAAKPKIDEQLSDEQNLEFSSKTESASPVSGVTFNNEAEEQEGGDMDSASRAGFTVTTEPDIKPVQTRDSGGDDDNQDSEGYQVESVPDR